SANYLVVNNEIRCHPGTVPKLELWKLSSNGDRVDAEIFVSGSDTDPIVEGWQGNLILASGNDDFSTGNASYFQYVFRVIDDQLHQVAICDASIRSDCPPFNSVVVSPTQKFGF